jgi:SAM-dependent methyltransferase
MNPDLELEAAAFDRQIIERIENGHIPDLRYVKKCEYFYNNVWRHPDYVKIDIWEIYSLLESALRKNVKNVNARVLEVGCGPGFISLELARSGFNVVGLELSLENIKVARRFADLDPHKLERGNLEYVVGDFFSNDDVNGKFDAIVFVGALHHFPDQYQILQRVKEVLNEGGIVIVHEPTRDRVEKRNAAVSQLIKTLLSLSGGYFEKIGPYKLTSEIEKDVNAGYLKLKYEGDSGEKVQSVNDNSAGHKEMMAELKKTFEEVDYQERYAFFHEIIGGLRFNDEKNREMAETIKLFDKYLCESGVVQPTEFFFVGRKSN